VPKIEKGKLIIFVNFNGRPDDLAAKLVDVRAFHRKMFTAETQRSQRDLTFSCAAETPAHEKHSACGGLNMLPAGRAGL
jgi:hypothetical protein